MNSNLLGSSLDYSAVLQAVVGVNGPGTASALPASSWSTSAEGSETTISPLEWLREEHYRGLRDVFHGAHTVCCGATDASGTTGQLGDVAPGAWGMALVQAVATASASPALEVEVGTAALARSRSVRNPIEALMTEATDALERLATMLE